jgi:hypothetical protein
MMFLTFLLSICYGGIWISIGVLLRNHFETILSMIIRKPIPDNLIDPINFLKTKNVIKVIGVFLVIIGILTMIAGLTTFIVSCITPYSSFNFKL